MVSIRSPHRSKGRPSAALALSASTPEFQSAPLTEARGDRYGPISRTFKPSFNPLPSPKQGETVYGRHGHGRRHGFNPLPSPKQGETRGALCLMPTFNLFQSAPLTEARGDRSPHTSLLLPALFQSAPLTEARGDMDWWPVALAV